VPSAGSQSCLDRPSPASRAGLPTAMTVASPDAPYARALAHELSRQISRAYTSTESWALEIGGAVEEALAVGAGLSDGLRGANTRVR